MFRDFQRCEACSRNIRWLFGSGLKIWDVKFEIFEYVSLRFENWDLEVWALRFKIWGLWFEVWRFRCEIWDLGFEFENWDFVLKFEVWSLKFGVWDIDLASKGFSRFLLIDILWFPMKIFGLEICDFEVWGLRFEVSSLRCELWDLGFEFEVWDLRLEIWRLWKPVFYKIF